VHWASDGVMGHWLCAFSEPAGYDCKAALLWTQGKGQFFFCDIPLVMKPACMDMHILEIPIDADSEILATICFLLLAITYSHMLITACLLSKDGVSKAVSTCTTYITVWCYSLGLASSSTSGRQHHLG
jgi:hypothetical protein